MANLLDDEFAIWQVTGMTLSEYLEKHSMPPSGFAAKIGVPASTIARLLKGYRKPGLDLLKKIADATNGEVMPNDFLAAPQTTEAA
jgi:transcriptional regulator with XRE-family HTH domain